MKFIEIVDGFSIRIDAITSINRKEHNKIIVHTENREYELPADFSRVMEAIEEKEEQEQPQVQQGLTSQYFSL